MTLLSLGCVAWGAFYAGAVGTATLRAALRGGRGPVPITALSPSDLDATVLFRPCAGAEPGLRDRLASSGGARRVVLAVARRDDGAFDDACAAAERLRAAGVHAEVVITAATSPNQKAGQLARAIAVAPRPARFVAIADSDVELESDTVPRLVAELVGAGGLAPAGAIWAPFVEARPRGIGGAILSGSLHSFPLLAGIDPTGFVGKLFVVRREILDAAGGFAAVDATLGEDVALARAWRSAGHVTRAASFVARVREREGVRATLERFTRWALVVREQRPALLLGYPLFLAALPLALALGVVGVGSRDPAVLAAGLVALAARMTLPFTVARIAGTPLPSFGSVLASDLALLYAALSATFDRRTSWRGRPLRLGPGGALEDAGDPRERPLREAREPAGLGAMDEVGVVGAARPEGAIALASPAVDALELALEEGPLLADAFVDVARGRDGRSDRDPELGLLLPREDVARRDGDERCAGREAAHRRRAREELERLEGRALSTLGVDPDEPTGGVEELGGVTDRSRAVARIARVDAEGAEPGEEGEASQVRRVHHGVGLGASLVTSEPDRDERIPPRGVVRHDDHRTAREGLHEPRAANDVDPSERAEEAGPRVAREEPGEPWRRTSRDHGGLP